MVELVSCYSLGDVGGLLMISPAGPQIHDKPKRYAAGPIVQFDRRVHAADIESTAYFLVKYASSFDTRKDNNQPPRQASFSDVRLGRPGTPAEKDHKNTYNTQYTR
jgi:hypothetical protein